MSEDNKNTVAAKITAKDVLKIAKEYFIEILKYSWLMAICAFLFGKYMHDRKMSTPTTYTANLSFTINKVEDENQQNIASLFGGAVNNSENDFNFASLREIISTRKIILKVLFHRISYRNQKDSKEDYLINHYLREFYYRNPNPETDLYFETDSIDPYDRKANNLLMYVHRTIVSNHLVVDIGGGEIMYLKTISTSEDFSYELIMAIFEELELYYSEKSIEKKRNFYEMAEKRTLQLRGELNNAEKKYIEFVNSNGAEAGGRNNILIKTQFLSTDLNKATESYFAALRSMEGAWVAYEGQKQSSAMSVVDPPLYPLFKAQPSPFLHMVLGAIAGGGFILVLVIAQKFIRDFWRKEKAKQEEPVEEEEKIMA